MASLRKKPRRRRVKKTRPLVSPTAVFTLYGPAKIGKTTLAATFPTPYFLATEPGHHYVSDKATVKRLKRRTGWKTFRKMIELEEIPDGIETVVIDTLAPLYEMCMEQVGTDNGWSHPEDTARGKGWNQVRREFYKYLELLSEDCEENGRRLVFIAHSKLTEIKTATRVVNRVEISLPGQARDIAIPLPDHVWYLGYMTGDDEDTMTATTDNRALWMLGTESVEAGSRNHQKTGILPHLPVDDTFSYILDNIE